jgi:nucleotide-binding universal stress UspA family protein
MSVFTKQPIVVPWDFSEMSSSALAKAVELADSTDQLEVVHVTPYPSAVEPSVVWGTYTEENIQENLLKSFRKEVPEDKYPGLKFVSYFGDPGSQITKHAQKIDAGLIVISSHGRTGVTRFLMGSVAERVVRLSPCPVLVLRERPE